MIHIVAAPGAPEPTLWRGRSKSNADPGSGTEDPLWRELVGDQLRRERHTRGQTLAEVAGTAGVSPQYLSEVERGRKEPSSEMIAAIGGALDLTLTDLIHSVSAALTSSTRPQAGSPRPRALALAA